MGLSHWLILTDGSDGLLQRADGTERTARRVSRAMPPSDQPKEAVSPPRVLPPRLQFVTPDTAVPDGVRREAKTKMRRPAVLRSTWIADVDGVSVRRRPPIWQGLFPQPACLIKGQLIPETLSPMRLLGYARVSVGSQASSLQVEALVSAGVEPHDVYSDLTLGGNELDRPGMRRLLECAHEGDTVVVWRIDCLGRSLIEVLDILTMLVERGIGVRSLQDGIEPGTPAGRQMLTLLVSLAKYERHFKGERIAAGMASARFAGTKLGRPPVDPDAIRDKLRAVEDLRARGMTAAGAAQLVGWSRATFYRHQQERGSRR